MGCMDRTLHRRRRYMDQVRPAYLPQSRCAAARDSRECRRDQRHHSTDRDSLRLESTCACMRARPKTLAASSRLIPLTTALAGHPRVNSRYPTPTPASTPCACMDGRIVMVYNDTTHGRTPLNLAVSHDGEHFTNFATLENTPGESIHIPRLSKRADGSLAITYTWQRKRIRFAYVPLSGGAAVKQHFSGDAQHLLLSSFLCTSFRRQHP